MNRLSPEINPALKSDVIELLNSTDIFTVLDFIRADSKQLEKITRLSFREILGVRKHLLKKYSAEPKNAFEYYKHTLQNSAIISTGIKSVDALLDGGLFTGNIYEICGLPTSGKTVFCLTLSKNISLQTKYNVYFLDSKQNFCARKIKQMLDNLTKEDVVEVMNKILVKQISTKYELINSLFEIKLELENGLKIRVIIIDSLPPLFLDSPDHTENNNILNHLVNTMRFIANEYHIAFVVTNLITLWNEGDFKNHDVFKERISCGKYWYDIPNVRIKIKKDGNIGIFSLVKYMKNLPSLCECPVNFSDLYVFC